MITRNDRLLISKVLKSLEHIRSNKPSDYVKDCWKIYQSTCDINTRLNDVIFNSILANVCDMEGIAPSYFREKHPSGPNVIYDIMFYTAERGPICWSVKTSLRERYKQADLEAIALKYVHRKALNYLITLNEEEAKNVKAKIKTGDIIGLDDVIVATQPEFDLMIADLKKFILIEPPTVKVIESSQIVTAEKVALL